MCLNNKNVTALISSTIDQPLKELLDLAITDWRTDVLPES